MQASDWIKCSERMPELVPNHKFSDDVLVWREWGEIGVGHISNGVWFVNGVPVYNVTHWMPIVGPDDVDSPQP